MGIPVANASTKAVVNTDGGQRAGLFIGSWEVGTMQPGAPLLTIHLTLAAPSGTVTGLGQVTQAISPPLDLASRLAGDYTYLTVMPEASHILVTLTGSAILDAPGLTGFGTSSPANLSLRMVLDADWQRGTATFSYLTADGWHRIESAAAHMSTSVNVAGKP